MSTQTVAAPAVPMAQRSVIRHEILPLYRRSLRAWLRVKAALFPPLIMPVFFLIVNTAALKDSMGQVPGIGDNYVAFFVPVAILMTVASAGSGSGLALVQDIDAGYFDKLLLAPITRTSIMVSRLMVDGTRAALQATLVLIVSVLIGGEVATGLVGALLLIALAFLFGLAYAGIGLNIALRTGSTEATQASFIIFFPLVFLAPTFVPMDRLAPWMQTVAKINPVTHVIEGLRSLTAVGWEWGELFQATIAIAAIATATLATAFAALRARTSR